MEGFLKSRPTLRCNLELRAGAYSASSDAENVASLPILPTKTHPDTLHESPQENASADVGWIFDHDKYMKRAQRRQALPYLPTTVPANFPTQVDTELAWDPESLGDKTQCIYHLSVAEIGEIHAALHEVKARGISPQAINRHTFQLPTLAPKLRAFSSQLHHGRGFFILRGLDPSKLEVEENALIFIGVSKHIGTTIGRQDRDGRMLYHIFDDDKSSVAREKRKLIYTNEMQPFHTDQHTDLLALQVIGCAADGGCPSIASGMKVYNELASSRPDLIHTLSDNNWIHDTFGQIPTYRKRPLLFSRDGRVVFNFSRRAITGSTTTPRTVGIPPITEAQAEAIDAVEFTARKNKIAVPIKPGDLYYINNLAMLHARDEWKDSHASQRHLIRLWLRDEESTWVRPPGLKRGHAKVFDEPAEISQMWNLTPGC